MKKIVILIVTLIILGLQVNTFANGSLSDGCVTIKVTEPIPGANCGGGTPITSEGDSSRGVGSYTYNVYECCIPKGTYTITNMLGEILKYFTYIISLVGVLFIVYNGIIYSTGGLDESAKGDAKKRIILTLTGLALLILAGPLLKIIAPWVYK